MADTNRHLLLGQRTNSLRINDQTSHSDPSSGFVLSRWLFLRLLGLVYFIAFTSLWGQIHGLVGSRGILPIADYLNAARDQIDSNVYWQLPTFCWWSASDLSLTAFCAMGTVLSILLMIGFAPILVLLLLWSLYLSLTIAGQVFLSFR